MIRSLLALSLVVGTLLLSSDINGGHPEEGYIDEKIREHMYTGEERLHYIISWSGGIKIGDLHMEISAKDLQQELYTIHVRVKDSGIFHFFYPINDTFDTVVKGPKRLPLSYAVEQREGRSYHVLRHTEYDQTRGIVRYQKNREAVEQFEVEGEVHNEFSSFFYTRMLRFDSSDPLIVPTFADKKRNEVVVTVQGKETIENMLLGTVQTIAVAPLMRFKGLYDKAGDTMIYFTNDSCRIPVRIHSKILIGSITAELANYTSSSCVQHPAHRSEIP